MMPLPIQFVLFMLVGWVSRQQQDVIEYLKAENRALREQLRGNGLRFTDAQRRRLARKAKPLGRRGLREISPIVTPDTLLRWYRELVAQKFDGSAARGPGRELHGTHPRTLEDRLKRLREERIAIVKDVSAVKQKSVFAVG